MQDQNTINSQTVETIHTYNYQYNDMEEHPNEFFPQLIPSGQFLDYVDCYDTEIQICGIDRVHGLWHNNKEIIDAHFNENIFFVSWVKKWLTAQGKRASDDEIVEKNSFFADIDLRANIKKLTGNIITDKEIREHREIIKKKLSTDDLLSEWVACNFSGNWLHIWFFGKPITVSKEIYKEAVKSMYDRMKALFPNDPQYRPDYACQNISRLCRLPGSFNYSRRDKYWLEPCKVVTFDFQEWIESSCIRDFPKIAEEASQRAVHHIEKYKHSAKWIKRDINVGVFSDTFDAINKIPILEVLAEILPQWSLAPDGKNFIGGNNNDYKWCFLLPQENVIIHQGTPHLSPIYGWFSPFTLARENLCNWDSARTFERFEQKYSHIKNIAENQFKKIKQEKDNKNSEEIKEYFKTMFAIAKEYDAIQPVNYLWYYMKKKNLSIPVELEEKFETILEDAIKIQKNLNCLIIPKEVIIEKWDKEINNDNISYLVDLITFDAKYKKRYIIKEALVNQNIHFDTWKTLKTFLCTQIPWWMPGEIDKEDRKNIIDIVRVFVFQGFKNFFPVKESEKVGMLWFTKKDKFIFNNWELDFQNKTFLPKNYDLKTEKGIRLSFDEKRSQEISVADSLSGLLDLKKYISQNDAFNSILIWYMICGIRRPEYQRLANEFPLLAIQGITGAGKTSLINLISWIVWIDRVTIEGTCDTPFGIEVAMNSLKGRFFFIDEVQKSGKKTLNSLQASFNGWSSYKGWAGGLWYKLEKYEKDCSLVICGESLPYQDEAFLNRCLFITQDAEFLVKWKVFDQEEKEKLIQLGFFAPENTALSSKDIRNLALAYYRPRFQAILMNKNDFDFEKYYDFAKKIISEYAKQNVDRRVLNNLSCAITGYLILKWQLESTEEIKLIIENYLQHYLNFRKEYVMSNQIIAYIIENIHEFCNWVSYYKDSRPTKPMLHIKYSKRFGGDLLIQTSGIIDRLEKQLENGIPKKQLQQQLENELGLVQVAKSLDWKSWSIKVAWSNLYWRKVPFATVEKNEALKRIRDRLLQHLEEQQGDLEHLLEWEEKVWAFGTDRQTIQTVKSKHDLKKLIEEIQETTSSAPRFWFIEVEEKDELDDVFSL